jgi:hypothetical protein
MGFTFREHDHTLVDRLAAVPLFGPGHAKKALNVMCGKAAGLEVTVFDYYYTIAVGNHPQHYRLTVAAFRDAEAGWPDFCLRPRAFYHRLASLLGSTEVTFEHDAPFTQAYRLQGSDEAAVREVFNDDVRHHFAQSHGLCVEAVGPDLVFYTGRQVSPEGVRPFLEQGFATLNTLQSGGQRA